MGRNASIMFFYFTKEYTHSPTHMCTCREGKGEGGEEGRERNFALLHIFKFCLQPYHLHIQLAKKFIRVFLYHLMVKPEQTFWPTQCLIFLLFINNL